MPWKKIGKYLLILVAGGTVGKGVPEAGEVFTISPELQQAIAAFLTSLATYVALKSNKP